MNAAAASSGRWRVLVAPALATLVAFAILIGLGAWQLKRRDWKEALLAQIEARSHGAPVPLPPESAWRSWRPEDDEFRRVAATGAFRHREEALVHGLAPAGRGMPAQGFYVFTPLELPGGAQVLVNRGFVPTELQDPASRPGPRPEGEVTVTGLLRAPEERGWFLPADAPRQNRFFARDPVAIAAAHDLARVAPFTIEAEAGPDPAAWPRAGIARPNLPNNHLQYALTWYGIALTLVGVFAAFARQRWREGASPPPPP